MMKRAIGIIVSLSLVWIIACGGDKTDELALAKQEFKAGLYSKAGITLEQFAEKHPENIEAQCLLAAVYNRQGKTQELDAAAGKLRKLGKPAMDKLVNVMSYELDMAEDMAEVLVVVGEPAVDVLTSILGDATVRVRESAISILTKIGAPAVKPLIKALDSTDALTRVGAAKALGNIGDTTAVEALTMKLEDGSPHVGVETAVALYKLGDKTHVDVITDGLSSDLLLTRRAAAAAMQDVVEEPPVEPVLKAATDNDIQVRAAAIQALGKVDDEKIIVPLIEALRSKDDAARVSAANALRETGKLAVMPLVDLISSEQDEGILYKAIQVLGDIGDERAVKALEKVYEEDKRPLVKQEAAIALNKIE